LAIEKLIRDDLLFFKTTNPRFRITKILLKIYTKISLETEFSRRVRPVVKRTILSTVVPECSIKH